MPTERIDILTRLRGVLAYIRDMNAAAAATSRLGTATDAAGRKMEHASRRSFLMNQALFTMRRFLYGATIGITALGAAAVVMGFKFNASVERTTIALEFLSKGQFDAKTQMKEFLQIARDTAFLPQQIIQAGQQLLAFGFTAEETNRTLRAMGDAIAALHLPQDTVNRITLALGQIRSKGKLMGEELRQLANANVLSFDALSEALGRNVFQLGNVADANIPADVAIDAILRSIETRFSGASARIRESTSGQFEILKGDIQTIMGGITFTAFEKAGGRLQSITEVTGRMFKLALEGNLTFYDMVRIVDEATGGIYHLVTAMETLHGFMKATWGSVKLVLDVLSPFIKLTLLAMYVFLEITTAVQNFIHLGGQPLVWILRILVFWWIAEVAIKRVSVLWSKRVAFWDAILAFGKRRLVFWTRILTFWTRKKTVEDIWAAAASRHAAVMEARRARILGVSTKATWFSVIATRAAAVATLLLSAAFWLSPIGWITGGIVVLVGVLIVLELKFRAVTRTVEFLWKKLTGLVDWINLKKGDLLAFFGPVGMAVGLASRLGAFEGGQSMPSFAGIGQQAVGMPRGPAGPAGIMPVEAQRLNLAALGGGGAPIRVTIVPQKIELDGREVAEVVWKHRLDRQARR